MTAPPAGQPDDLVRAHRGLVLGVCRRMLGDRVQAEDVAQEVFTRFFLSGADHEARSVPAWLHTAAANACRDVLRRRHTQPAIERLGDRLVEADPQTDPWAGLRGDVDEALSRLEAEDRDVLVRHFLHGETLAGIGADRGVSAVAMHKRLHGALDRLRRVLRGMGCAGAAFAAAALTQAHAETGAITGGGFARSAIGSSAGSAGRAKIWLAGLGAMVAVIAVVLTMAPVTQREHAAGGPPAAVAAVVEPVVEPVVPSLVLTEYVPHGSEVKTHIIAVGADGTQRDLGSFSIDPKRADVTDAVRARDGAIWAWTWSGTYGQPAQLLRLGGDGRSEIVALPPLTITALIAHPDGTLLIACSGRGQLFAWHPDSRQLTPLPRGAGMRPWTRPFSSDDLVGGGRSDSAALPLAYPTDITLASDGTILVADRGLEQEPRIAGRVLRYANDGSELPPVPLPPGMRPESIAVDRQGRILVCAGRALWRCGGTDGRDWTRLGPEGRYPGRIRVDRDGRVLVHDFKQRALISLGRDGDEAPVVILPLTAGTFRLTLDDDAH